MLKAYRELHAQISARASDAKGKKWRAAYQELPPQSDQLTLAYRYLIEKLLGMSPAPLQPLITRAGAPMRSSENPHHAVCHRATACELAMLYRKAELVEADLIDAYLHQLFPFPAFWLQEGESLPAFKRPSDQLAPPDDLELGLSLKRAGPFSVALTTTGWKTGLASIKKGEAQILTLGPSTWPSAHFGIHLSPIEIAKAGEAIPGVHIKRQGPLYHYAGWSRTIAQNHHLWCELSLQVQQDMDLDIRFLDLKGCKLSILMAVKAAALNIGDGLTLTRSDLKKYRGAVKTVALQSKDEEMILVPKQRGQLEVVPLAGDASYWGADFLLIYSLCDQMPHVGWTVY